MAQSRLTFWKCHRHTEVCEGQWNWSEKKFFQHKCTVIHSTKKNNFIMIRITGGGVLLCVLFNPICTLLL